VAARARSVSTDSEAQSAPCRWYKRLATSHHRQRREMQMVQSERPCSRRLKTRDASPLRSNHSAHPHRMRRAKRIRRVHTANVADIPARDESREVAISITGLRIERSDYRSRD
jgi:hypothetical protein